MIAPEPFLVIRPRLYQVEPAKLAIPIAPQLESVRVAFVSGLADSLVVERRRVVLADGRSVPSERLVVATGSVMARPPFRVSSLALSVDQLPDAIQFDARLRDLVGAGGSTVTVAVVGAGFTGIELATELRDRVAAHGGSAAGEAARVVLIDRAPVVGVELGEGPRAAIEEALAAARVELCLGVEIAAVTPLAVEFADGTMLAADVVVLATGLRAAPFAASVPGPRDHAGRAEVDEYLRVPVAPEIFVAGDAAHAETGTGRTALQFCQHAFATRSLCWRECRAGTAR